MKTKLGLLLATAAIATLAAAPTLAQTKLTAYVADLYDPTANPASKAVWDELIAEYKKIKPDVTIEMVDFMADVNTYFAWLTTRFAAGDPPDIAWQQFYTRNEEMDTRWLPVNEYIEQPNPYIPAGQPGHDRWADQFLPNVMAQIRAGDGNWYQINTNWVETGFYTNNDILAANGIDATTWKDWGDMIQSCKDLRAKGVQPIGVFMTPGWSTYQWLDDIIITGAFADVIQGWYLEKYNNEYLPWRQLNPEEFAKAIKDGKFSVQDPRFDTYLQLTKDVADNCLVEGFAGIPEYDSMFKLFSEGRVAMVWLGSWSAPLLSELTFNVGSTYVPPFSKEDSPYAIHETSYRVGGPSGSGQIGFPKVTTDRGTTDEAIDFIKFITAPQNYQKIADATSGLIPVLQGVEPAEVAKTFVDIAQLPERGLTDPIGRLTQEYGTEHNRLMQSFMLGELSAEDLKPQYQRALERAVEDLCDEHDDWAWCKE